MEGISAELGKVNHEKNILYEKHLFLKKKSRILKMQLDKYQGSGVPVSFSGWPPGILSSLSPSLKVSSHSLKGSNDNTKEKPIKIQKTNFRLF